LKRLLHVCCAGCLSDVARCLASDGTELVLLFANPNIHPLVEFRRRRKSARLLAARLGLGLEEDGYGLGEFLAALHDAARTSPEILAPGGRSGGNPARCRVCYGMRMDRAAARARELGADAFTTTLLVSRQQDRQAVVEAGEHAAAVHGVRFEAPDLRHLHGSDAARLEGLGEGSRGPRDLKLYRQGYCGCVFSEEERFRETSRGD